MKDFNEKKNEFIKIEELLMSQFSRDERVQELLKNGSFITNLSRSSFDYFDELKSDIYFQDRKGLDEFIELINQYDFGGRFLTVIDRKNGKKKSTKYYELFFSDDKSYKLLVNLDKTHRSRKITNSYYVLKDKTFSLNFKK